MTTRGNNANGLFATGHRNNFVNKGKINTSGNWAHGLYVHNGNTNSLTNTGTITTSGERGYGLFAYSDSNTITNSGTVRTSGLNGFGVLALGASNTVNNSGKIIVRSGHSVRMSGADSTLNLFRGSVLQGEILFTHADSATLNLDAGLNAVVHTDASVPDTITSTGVYAVSGDTIINSDLTDYAGQNEVGITAARLIVDAVDTRRRTWNSAQTSDCDGPWAGVLAVQSAILATTTR